MSKRCTNCGAQLVGVKCSYCGTQHDPDHQADDTQDALGGIDELAAMIGPLPKSEPVLGVLIHRPRCIG